MSGHDWPRPKALHHLGWHSKLLLREVRSHHTVSRIVHVPSLFLLPFLAVVAWWMRSLALAWSRVGLSMVLHHVVSLANHRIWHHLLVRCLHHSWLRLEEMVLFLPITVLLVTNNGLFASMLFLPGRRIAIVWSLVVEIVHDKARPSWTVVPLFRHIITAKNN